MAYTTATLVKKFQRGNNYGFVIDFTGNAGEPPVQEQLNFSGNLSVRQIKTQVYQRIDSLNNRAVIDSIQEGVAIAAPTPPTPDPDKDAFLAKVTEVSALLRSVELGIMAIDDTRLTSRQTELQNMVAARQNLLFELM